MAPRQGDIYWAFVEGPRRRPIVVMSREELNQGDYVLGMTFTSARLRERERLPNCVLFHEGEFGLTKTCVAQAETVSMISKQDLDLEDGFIDQVKGEKLRELVKALGNVVGAECDLL